jgi:hypothetical protein
MGVKLCLTLSRDGVLKVLRRIKPLSKVALTKNESELHKYSSNNKRSAKVSNNTHTPSF